METEGNEIQEEISENLVNNETHDFNTFNLSNKCSTGTSIANDIVKELKKEIEELKREVYSIKSLLSFTNFDNNNTNNSPSCFSYWKTVKIQELFGQNINQLVKKDLAEILKINSTYKEERKLIVDTMSTIRKSCLSQYNLMDANQKKIALQQIALKYSNIFCNIQMKSSGDVAAILRVFVKGFKNSNDYNNRKSFLSILFVLIFYVDGSDRKRRKYEQLNVSSNDYFLDTFLHTISHTFYITSIGFTFIERKRFIIVINRRRYTTKNTIISCVDNTN